MRRPLVLTLVPLLALAGAIGWAIVHVREVEARGEPALYARAVAWEKSLTEPGTESPLTFVHPEARGDPRLREWLSDVAHVFGEAAGTQVLQSKAVSAQEGESTYAVDVADPRRGQGRIAFRWTRGSDGVWYVVPKFLDASPRPSR